MVVPGRRTGYDEIIAMDDRLQKHLARFDLTWEGVHIGCAM
jgi:sigma54-dependent transcription regulator